MTKENADNGASPQLLAIIAAILEKYGLDDVSQIHWYMVRDIDQDRRDQLADYIHMFNQA